MNLVHASFSEAQEAFLLIVEQLNLFAGAQGTQPARPSPEKGPVEIRVIPEAPGRFRRCCPYCHAPVVWRYFGRDEGEGLDLKSERPYCAAHGPLRLYRVVDFQWPLGPAVVWVATIHERAHPRMLTSPVLVRRARPAAARWKRARVEPPAQETVVSIDLTGRALSRQIRRELRRAA